MTSSTPLQKGNSSPGLSSSKSRRLRNEHSAIGMRNFFRIACLSVLAFTAPAAAQEQGPLLGDLPEAPKETAPPTPGDQQMFDQGTAYYDRGDYVHAYQVFYWLAEHDDVAAMRNVALMKRRGQGTARDPQGAMEYLKEAADAGLPTAEADLADM